MWLGVCCGLVLFILYTYSLLISSGNDTSAVDPIHLMAVVVCSSLLYVVCVHDIAVDFTVRIENDSERLLYEKNRFSDVSENLF